MFGRSRGSLVRVMAWLGLALSPAGAWAADGVASAVAPSVGFGALILVAIIVAAAAAFVWRGRQGAAALGRERARLAAVLAELEGTLGGIPGARCRWPRGPRAETSAPCSPAGLRGPGPPPSA